MFKHYKEKLSTVLRFIAAEYGYCHSNKWFINKLEELTKRRCSRQNVTQVLGNTKQRHQMQNKDLLDKARKFLFCCGGDAVLARKLVEYVAR